MTDEELVEGFESGALSAGLFDHRAHVRVGWWYLTHYSQDDAIERIKRNLRAFATLNGASGKYDDAMTVAYMLAIAECVQRSGGLAWPEFAAQYPELFTRSSAEPSSAHSRIDRVP